MPSWGASPNLMLTKVSRYMVYTNSHSKIVVRNSSAPGLSQSSVNVENTTGFESTLHEMECSDGQSISILRTWNGEQYASLTEVWRKYFPEVNRNHLTSALKRLGLDTHMPTGQQATLLRSAGVISLRYLWVTICNVKHSLLEVIQSG